MKKNYADNNEIEDLQIEIFNLKNMTKVLLNYFREKEEEKNCKEISLLFSEILVKLVIEDPNTEIPDFNANSFVNGLLSNTISYLIARYGDKVAENIDLSSLPFFKKK